jgi:hypothetical protein
MIKLSHLIIEGRLEDFKDKYASLPPETQNAIIRNDPSRNHKYLDWAGRIVTSDPKIDLGAFLRDLQSFDKYQASLGDVNKYKTYNDLKHALASRQKSNKEKTKEGAEILIDNDEFLVVAPGTHDSCRYYGNRTNWCITGSEDWWNDYYYKNTIIIVLDRRDNEKYAVVGRSEYGNYDVYDKNDHALSYRGFTDETSDDSWPEYVQEAIEDYMSGDNIERREDDFKGIQIKEYENDYGKDNTWKEYLECVHKDYDVLEDVNIELFKEVAALRGVSEDDLDSMRHSYMYWNIENNHNSGDNYSDIGDVDDAEDFDKAIKEYGRGEDAEKNLGSIVTEYVRRASGILDALEIVRNSVGEVIFDKLYNKGTLDDDMIESIDQYNAKLNSNQQLSLQGIDGGKQVVKINTIQDVIYVLRNTGHFTMGDYLASVVGIKESIKSPKTRILRG